MSGSTEPSFLERAEAAIAYDKRQYWCEEAFGSEWDIMNTDGGGVLVYNGTNKYTEELYRDSCKEYEQIKSNLDKKYGPKIDNIEDQMEADVNPVGGVELSLSNLDFSNLHGFNFDAVNKTIIALCKKNSTSNNIIALGDDIKSDHKESELSDKDSILKKSNNNKSIMLWQHFCAFLSMFHQVGDRESVSFSLDPAERLEKNKSNQDIKMKKVYYPENLRWSKAGEVMFDADLFIKTLLYDMHPNITKHIPHYRSYINTVLENTSWDDNGNSNDDQSNWHRLWIVLDEIQQFEEGNSIMVEKIKFKINVRKMNIESGALHDDLSGNENSALMEFIQHMNNNIQIIHKHSLFLQRLEGVFRALILAKFAYNNDISFNMQIINEICDKQKNELQEYGLSFELPSLVKTVSKKREINYGDSVMKQTRTRTFSGGIDLNINPKNMKETEETIKMREKLTSLNKLFGKINQTISKIQNQEKKNKCAFEKLFDFKNKENEQYTAILFPNILFDSKNENICDRDDCKQAISWQKQYIFDDKHYCKNHYDEKRYCNCTRCDIRIDRLNDEYKIMQSNDTELLLHLTCMKCDECQKILNGTQTIMDSKNSMYCSESCANKNVPSVNINNMICSKCNNSISGGYIQFGDNVLHVECLICDECKQVIRNNNTAMDGNNNVFCSETCANKKVIKSMDDNATNLTCHKCKNEILLTDNGFVTMGNNIMLHRGCTVCYQCGKGLTGGVVMDGDKNMFCSSECGNIFHHQ